MAKKGKVSLVRIDRARHMFISPPGRLSFPHLFTPNAVEENQEPSFSCDVIFDDLDILKVDYKGKAASTPSVLRAIQNVMVDQWGKDPKKWPKVKYPAVKKGDDKTYDDGKPMQGYAGKRYISPRTGQKYPPRLYSKDGKPARMEDLYAGCYCRVQVLCRPYSTTLGEGVSLRLLAVMKTREGQPFGLGGDFFDFEDGDDDQSEISEELEETETELWQL